MQALYEGSVAHSSPHLASPLGAGKLPAPLFAAYISRIRLYPLQINLTSR
jgi:hypothetical protein